jgi:LacI family transcriptional regulator
VHQPVRDLAAEALRLLVAQASTPIAQAKNSGVHLLGHKIVHRQSATRPDDAQSPPKLVAG